MNSNVMLFDVPDRPKADLCEWRTYLPPVFVGFFETALIGQHGAPREAPPL